MVGLRGVVRYGRKLVEMKVCERYILIRIDFQLRVLTGFSIATSFIADF